MARNVMGPLYDAWINQRLEPRTRATVLSLAGQVDAAGQIISGPIAALVSLWSVRAALTAAAALLLPAFPLIGRANRMPMKGSSAAPAQQPTP
jgi:DHA3 family tetracycline resistance protein-like MFS transporter